MKEKDVGNLGEKYSIRRAKIYEVKGMDIIEEGERSSFKSRMTGVIQTDD